MYPEFLHIGGYRLAVDSLEYLLQGGGIDQILFGKFCNCKSLIQVLRQLLMYFLYQFGLPGEVLRQFFLLRFRSVYKELHADRETGC